MYCTCPEQPRSFPNSRTNKNWKHSSNYKLLCTLKSDLKSLSWFNFFLYMHFNLEVSQMDSSVLKRYETYWTNLNIFNSRKRERRGNEVPNRNQENTPIDCDCVVRSRMIKQWRNDQHHQGVSFYSISVLVIWRIAKIGGIWKKPCDYALFITSIVFKEISTPVHVLFSSCR